VATVTRARTITPDPPAARVRESRSVIGLSFLGIAQAVPFHGDARRAPGQQGILDPDPRPGKAGELITPRTESASEVTVMMKVTGLQNRLLSNVLA
jgi:hypothetical protein